MEIGEVMKKKSKTILFVFIVIGVVILNFTYKNKNEETKTKQRKQNNLAIMIKGDSGEYVSSNEIPKGNYVLNEEKTICENGGKVVSYNNSTGQIGFSFLGSDRCSLYFDKIIDNEKPVISNLTVNDTTVTATLTDNIELSGYGISTSNSTEPTSWTTISGTTYNLSTTITTEGTYYLWVKDSSDNKTVSEVIDLEKKGYQTILINNGGGATTADAAISYIKGKGTPNFANTATTNEGMYAKEDDYTTTTGMKSYYFRGAVNNNWVKFGKEGNKDIYWRIIRINGDGSIRMIYSGTTAPTSSTATVMTGTGTQISTSVFKSSRDKAEYVGYQYIERQQHGYGKCNRTSASCTVNGNTVYNSAIKQAIDKWYAGTTLKDNDLIADQIFCNDRSASTSAVAYLPTNYTTLTSWNSTGTAYYYGAYGRLSKSKSPVLTCAVDGDRFTVNKINGKGNSALTYPVGLITADEVAMAGGKLGSDNNTYYLYTNQDYWLGSPYSFSSSLACAFEFYVSSSGFLDSNYVAINYGARPVVSLSSKAKLSGNGTYSNPYTVS